MTPQCQHCGAQVTRRYARVLGDENNEVHRCPSCDSKHRRWHGSSAGNDVDWPDPDDQENRNRGRLVDDTAPVMPLLPDGGAWTDRHEEDDDACC